MLLATCTETCSCFWAGGVWIGSCLLFWTCINQAVTADTHIYITNGNPAQCHFSLHYDWRSHWRTGDLPNFTSVNLICRPFKFKLQGSRLFREMLSRLWPTPVSTLQFFSLLLLLFITSAVLVFFHYLIDLAIFARYSSILAASLFTVAVMETHAVCIRLLYCFPGGCSAHTGLLNCLFWWNWLIVPGKLPFLLVKWINFCLFFQM